MKVLPVALSLLFFANSIPALAKDKGLKSDPKLKEAVQLGMRQSKKAENKVKIDLTNVTSKGNARTAAPPKYQRPTAPPGSDTNEFKQK